MKCATWMIRNFVQRQLQFVRVLTEMGLWDRTHEYNSAAAHSSDDALPQGERCVVASSPSRIRGGSAWSRTGTSLASTKDVIAHVVTMRQRR